VLSQHEQDARVVIQVRGLTKRYGDVVAVDDLTFDVRPGLITGFLGPNGAGKSTTMRMVLGLDRPTSGTATVGGRRMTTVAEPLRHVGALLDPTAVHPGRSGRDHLRVAARTAGLPNRRVDEVLEPDLLEKAARRRVKGYSLGMRQRLGIATALLADPAVLMFDEPVNGLDLDGVRWVRGLLRQLADEGRTVLYSSHLMSEVQQTADRLVIIGRGRLIADATTDEVLRGLGGAQVRVRTPDPEQLFLAMRQRRWQVRRHEDGAIEVQASRVEVGELAHALGLPVHELTEVGQSLEDVFVELTGSSVEFSGGAQPLAAEGAR
jgi:ABC-2 type transport system ATP-binding protein